MDEPDEHDGTDAKNRAVARAQARVGHRAAENLVADEQEEQEQRAREPGIPRPPGAPDRLPPNGPRDQHDPREHGADLGRSLGEAVEPGILKKQKENAREPDENHSQLGGHGSRDVHIENLLRGALESLDRRERQRPHIDTAEQGESGQHDPAPLLRETHSSTVCGKSQNANPRNTMSYAASNLSQPDTSLKGRPASSRAVACTA